MLGGGCLGPSSGLLLKPLCCWRFSCPTPPPHRPVRQQVLKSQWNDTALVLWMNALLKRCLRAWRLHAIDAAASRTEEALVL
jgi:hypothetical protein